MLVGGELDGHCFRDQALAFCARAGAAELGYRATSLATLTSMVAGGAGVTLLPAMAVATENRRRGLHIRRAACEKRISAAGAGSRSRRPRSA
jgi:LysR family hydrogen peroxide-inducible transcriptional activator